MNRTVMRKFIQFAAVFIVSLFCMSTTCGDGTHYGCDFFNDSSSSVFVYYCLCDARIDSLTASDALFNYNHIYEVKPGDKYSWGREVLDSDDNYNTLQIMVFDKSIFDDCTLGEIKERNIYDKLYVIPIEETTPDNLVIRYTGREALGLRL